MSVLFISSAGPFRSADAGGALFSRILLLILLWALSAAGAEAMSKAPPEPFVEGQLLIRFHDGVAPERAEEIIHLEGGEVLEVIGHSRIYLIALPEDMAVPEGVEAFEKYPEIRYAEPNFRVKALEGR